MLVIIIRTVNNKCNINKNNDCNDDSVLREASLSINSDSNHASSHQNKSLIPSSANNTNNACKDNDYNNDSVLREGLLSINSGSNPATLVIM